MSGDNIAGIIILLIVGFAVFGAISSEQQTNIHKKIMFEQCLRDGIKEYECYHKVLK